MIMEQSSGQAIDFNQYEVERRIPAKSLSFLDINLKYVRKTVELFINSAKQVIIHNFPVQQQMNNLQAHQQMKNTCLVILDLDKQKIRKVIKDHYKNIYDQLCKLIFPNYLTQPTFLQFHQKFQQILPLVLDSFDQIVKKSIKYGQIQKISEFSDILNSNFTEYLSNDWKHYECVIKKDLERLEQQKRSIQERRIKQRQNVRLNQEKQIEYAHIEKLKMLEIECKRLELQKDNQEILISQQLQLKQQEQSSEQQCQQQMVYHRIGIEPKTLELFATEMVLSKALQTLQQFDFLRYETIVQIALGERRLKHKNYYRNYCLMNFMLEQVWTVKLFAKNIYIDVDLNGNRTSQNIYANFMFIAKDKIMVMESYRNRKFDLSGLDGYNFSDKLAKFQSSVVDEDREDGKVKVNAQEAFRSEPGGPSLLLTMVSGMISIGNLRIEARGGKGSEGANGGTRQKFNGANGARRGYGGICLKGSVNLYDPRNNFKKVVYKGVIFEEGDEGDRDGSRGYSYNGNKGNESFVSPFNPPDWSQATYKQLQPEKLTSANTTTNLAINYY